jgi:hypothetical protein
MIALAKNLYITVKEVCMVKIYDNPAVCLQDRGKFLPSFQVLLFRSHQKLSTPPGGVYGKNFGLLSFSLSRDLEMWAE